MIPIEGRISGSLIFQNCAQPVIAVHLGGLDHLVGDRQQRGIDQHHRDADELPDRDQRQRGQRSRPPCPARARTDDFSPTASSIAGRDAPDRRQDQLPDEADDDEAQDRGDEDRGAVEGSPSAAAGWTEAPPAAMPIGFCTTMWIRKNQALLPSAFQNAPTSADRRRACGNWQGPRNARSRSTVDTATGPACRTAG